MEQWLYVLLALLSSCGLIFLEESLSAWLKLSRFRGYDFEMPKGHEFMQYYNQSLP